MRRSRREHTKEIPADRVVNRMHDWSALATAATLQT